MQLVVDHLTVARGARIVIHDLSFQVTAGSALVLKGANGAGKTTLLRAIAGFLPPHRGSLQLQDDAGSQLHEDEAELAEHCHYIGHANSIRGALTVSENVRFWSEYLADGPASTLPDATNVASHASGVGARVEAALQAFDLEALRDIPARYLSAGQKRRLGLARLLAAPRALWLLDEPTVSLDTASVTLLSNVVADHLANGGLVLAATHIPLGLSSARDLELKPEPYGVELDEMAL